MEPFRAVETLVGDPWKPYERVNLFIYPSHSYKIPAGSVFGLHPILGYPSHPSLTTDGKWLRKNVVYLFMKWSLSIEGANGLLSLMRSQSLRLFLHQDFFLFRRLTKFHYQLHYPLRTECPNSAKRSVPCHRVRL